MRAKIVVLLLFSMMYMLAPVHAAAPVTDGLRLHVAADEITGLSDGDPVAIWLDQSGNNNTLTSSEEARPTYITGALNGLPVVRFDGLLSTVTGDWMDFAADILDVRTIFFVIKEDADVTDLGKPRAFISAASGSPWHRSTNTSRYIYSGAWAPAVVTAGTTKINGGVVDAVDTDENPVSFPTEMSILSTVTAANNTAGQIGRDVARWDRYWDGDIAEVLIYNRVLSTTEENEVGFYLAQKYGLTTSYTSDEPYLVGISPATGTAHVSITPTLSWSAASSVSPTYDVYFGTDPNSDFSLVRDDTTDSEYTPTPLDYLTTYYWQVDINDEGQTYPGSMYTFSTGGKAWEPVPADGFIGASIPETMVSWSSDNFATSFKVYADIWDPNSTDPLPEITEVTDPTALIPTPDENTVYVWRVDEYVDGALIAEGDEWLLMTGGLIGHWKLDEDRVTDPNLTDSSGNEYHGLIVGDTTTIPGAVGNAAMFNGADRGEIDPFNMSFDALTITMWIKPAAGVNLSTRGLMMTNVPEGICGLNLESGQVRYHWGATAAWGFNSGLNSVADQWQFVALVVEPSQATLYLNQDSAINAIPHQPVTYNVLSMLGMDPRRLSQADRYLTGGMDDVKFYNRALNATELLELYDSSDIAKNPIPAVGAIDVPISTTLRWEAGPDAVSYELYYGESANDGWDNGPIALTEAEYGVSGLQLDTEYKWKVDVITEAGTTGGNTWTFTTVPPRAYNPDPADTATGIHPDAVLSWDEGEGGPYNHRVYFGTDESAVTAATPESDEYKELVMSPDSSFDPFDTEWMAWSTTYFWRIDEVTLDGNTVYEGDVWRFSTIEPVCTDPVIAAADISGDCVITLDDFAMMAASWLGCGLEPIEACP